jgi:hypothetical protein
MTLEEARHVLGLQANFWSHIDRSPDRVDYQLFPRLLSIAERAWSPQSVKDWAEFKRRMKLHLRELEWMGIHYNPLDLADPIGTWSPKEMNEEYKVLSWEVTEHVKKKGVYRAHFQYTHGAHRLGIEWVALFRGGEEVDRDTHRGVTGAKDENNIYRLRVDEVEEGATFHLEASVRSEGGTDSNGVVYFLEEKEP